MALPATDVICIRNEPLKCEALCSLCQNDHPCVGASLFTKEQLFYNFDKITEIIYPSPETPRSADAFYLKNKKIYFIEIKDQKIDDLLIYNSKQKEIIEKLLDSIYTVRKNITYFKDYSLASFNLLYSHLKRKGEASMKINLRVLGNSFGIKISNNSVTIPTGKINTYSTHTTKHNREKLTEKTDYILDFKLCFCDSIDETVFNIKL